MKHEYEPLLWPDPLAATVYKTEQEAEADIRRWGELQPHHAGLPLRPLGARKLTAQPNNPNPMRVTEWRGFRCNYSSVPAPHDCRWQVRWAKLKNGTYVVERSAVPHKDHTDQPVKTPPATHSPTTTSSSLPSPPHPQQHSTTLGYKGATPGYKGATPGYGILTRECVRVRGGGVGGGVGEGFAATRLRAHAGDEEPH